MYNTARETSIWRDQSLARPVFGETSLWVIKPWNTSKSSHALYIYHTQVIKPWNISKSSHALYIYHTQVIKHWNTSKSSHALYIYHTQVIKPWGTSKSSSSSLAVPDQPMCPPSPDLSHLTPEEIAAIHEVVRRQEEFDKQEEDRVRKLKEELEGLQQQLALRSVASTHNKTLVDLRLCRLCFKTKFADGVGRVCSDCQQRVCPQCGAFCKPKSSFKRNKSMRPLAL
ncbi:Rab-3-interacting molecule unc-10 [Bulinus truncatus]|nr:Rab-3-interacting molecule unc-10 [Bulinus truncatus]